MTARNNSLAALGLAGFIAAAGALPLAAADSADPIKLTLHDWTGQLITTQLMGEVLKQAGLNVEYVQADYLAQFAGLETGDLHVAMELWDTTGRDAMDAATATGKVEVFGATGMKAKEEWWYPLYMKEKCPGLPNWEALNQPPWRRRSVCQMWCGGGCGWGCDCGCVCGGHEVRARRA